MERREFLLARSAAALAGCAAGIYSRYRARSRLSARSRWRSRLTMDGKKYDDIDSVIRVQRGAKEILEIPNAPISMPHPIHLRGFHFRVLKRTALYGPAKALGRHDGLPTADLGYKNTVTVWPSERGRIVIDFSTAQEGP